MQAQSPQNRGDELFAQGRYAEARDAYDAALRVNVADEAARKGEVKSSEKLALAQRVQGDYNGALAALLHARSLVADDPRLLLDLGILEDEMHLYRDADQVLAMALQLRPKDPQTIYAAARVKLDLQQLPAAEAGLRAYLRTDPQDATAHYGLGRVLQMAQRSEEAEAEFHESIALQPGQTESYFQLGQLALDHGRFDDAVAQFERVIAANPRHGGALAGAGQARYRQKQFVAAADYLRRAISVAPDYQPAHYYYGLTLARLVGRKDESERELKTASRMAEEQNSREAKRLQLNGDASQPH